MNPAIFAGLVIVFMFAVLTTLVLLVGDGRRSVEGDKQDEGPNDWL